MTYVPGDNWIICDLSGRKVLMSKSRKTWDGLRVHPDYWSPRHPQLDVRSRADKQQVVDGRGRPADIFIESVPQYLYRDDFTTNLGIGLIDGTATEPGPGTRYLCDDHDDPTTTLSYISGGVLVLDGTDDTQVYRILGPAGATDRVNGRTVIAKIKLTDINSDYYIEWFYDDFIFPGLYFTSVIDANLKIYNSIALDELGTYVLNTEYYVAIQLHTTGISSYIKGGAYTDWTYLITSVVGGACTPVLPAIWYSGGAGVLDYLYTMRVPLVPITDISQLDDYID